MTKKKRQLEYTVTLPDHTTRLFRTKQQISSGLGISSHKVDKSLREDEWVYVSNLKGWIRITVKEVE